MERSLAFDVAGLGFTIQNRWVPDGRVRWCWMSLGGEALMLQEASQSTYPGNHVRALIGNAPLGRIGAGGIAIGEVRS